MTIPPPPIYVLDIECYTNYFLVMVRNVHRGEAMVVFERFNDQILYSAPLPEGTAVTFNGINYDMPLWSLAQTGAANATLKKASDAIILRNLKPWDVEREFGFQRIELDHIDLIEVAPGQASLKIYGGRLHSRRMQDLPIEPSAIIGWDDRMALIHYCGNDLQTTIDLYHTLRPQLELREAMGAEFGLDLRSKSDAQIAEAVIRSEIEKRVGHRVYRPELARDYKFKYRPPTHIRFDSHGLTRALDLIRETEFTLSDTGSVELPKLLESLHLRIGNGVYRMGIGGIHSSEKSVAYVAGPHQRIVDRDVASYYPSLILNMGMYPATLGQDFQGVYQSFVTRRLEAKASGNKVWADALKIVLNGTFGKLGSKWSIFYSPDQLIAVTLTGQLSLLMLIESLESNGFTVISANTDGVVTLVPPERTELFEALVAAWEITTGLVTEETEYAALYSRDVNNYIAIKPDGKVKLKGAYAFEGMQKNPTNKICVAAVLAYLTNNTPISDTIYSGFDIRDFLTIRQVKGGATKDGAYLGKAVRWYYARGQDGHIAYQINGNKVAGSDGAKPLMELPDVMPPDVDYEWYVRDAQAMLHEVGVV